MRLAILGGGGFRVPLVFSAVAEARHRVDISEVVLYDVEEARLATMSAVLGGVAADLPDAPAVRTTTDLDDAVRGADVVFSAIRVGGDRKSNV